MSQGVSFADNDYYDDEPEPASQKQKQRPPGGGGSSVFCPNCGGKEIEQQGASGQTVCMECGVVVEENAIVSSLEFVEGAGGAASMVGQFVSATSSKAYTGGGGAGGRRPFSRDSRETTLANGRRRIAEVANRLRLGNQFIDAAHRLFTIAVEKNFVQGRRTTHVVASCLYIVCRQEKSQQMLIDFSDALQVNVYSLGTCFLKFRRLLGLKLEIIDPALYVYRFAAHLDLDEKANAVSLTAIRLVGRMKRDWIVAGRRPAGICAAALLIAARAHGFKKHHQDVTRILKVCGMTVTNRVREFEMTPAANLTLDEFHDTELEYEADPPAYSRNKIMEARAKAIQDGNTKLLESGVLDDPRDGPLKSQAWRMGESDSKRAQEFKQLYVNLERDLVGESKKKEALEALTPVKDYPTVPVQEKQIVTREGSKTLPPELAKAYPKTHNGKLLILADHATKEEMQESMAYVEGKLNITEWKECMPESMEDELNDIFRSEEEEMQKAAIFNKINKDYIEQQERKESLIREEMEAAGLDYDDAAQLAGHARYTKSGRKRKKKGGGGDEDANDGTTEEQLRAAMAGRKVSRKINYDALSSIFDDDGSLGNVSGTTGGEAGGEESLYDVI